MFCLYSVLPPLLLLLPPILLDRINYDLKEEGPEFFGSSASFLSSCNNCGDFIASEDDAGFFYCHTCS